MPPETPASILIPTPKELGINVSGTRIPTPEELGIQLGRK
jgi:hypothetical protein